ncbi:MAG: hypothetical protein GEU93_12595 [Propionibacteriales bacterium]|nr:hypothetical protein [Propionibacteriales bacterium]
MTIDNAIRTAARAGTVVIPLTLGCVAAPALADTPNTWTEPEPMSVLKALLIFGGIPVLLALIIALLVIAPSLIRRDRQQRGVTSWTEPEWFGGPGDAEPAEARSGAGAADTSPGSSPDPGDQPGGASARW